MSTTTNHRRIWTLTDWIGFGQRCQATRALIIKFIDEFPRTTGVTIHLAKRLYKVEAKLVTAMLATESVLASEQGEECEVTRLIHGDNYCALIGPVGLGYKPSKEKPLSQEQWLEIGDKGRALRESIRGLCRVVVTNKYIKMNLINRYDQIDKSWTDAKCMLDDLLCKQYIGRDFSGVITTVLYGPECCTSDRP